MHRQEFPFSFIRKKSTVEGLPSAVLSMDAAQERVSPRTGYPTIKRWCFFAMKRTKPYHIPTLTL